MNYGIKEIRNRVLLMSVLVILLCFNAVNVNALIGVKEGGVPGEIVLKGMNGETVDVSRHFGKRPVIIVFWELTLGKSFLNYSLDELRFLNSFYKEYHDSRGIEIFGVYTPEEEKVIPPEEMEAVRNLIKVNEIQFPVLIDRGFRTFRRYGVIALPTTVMVNSEGRVEFIYPSFPLAARKIFTEEIEKLAGIVRASADQDTREEEKPDTKAGRLYSYALQMYKKGLYEQAVSPLRKSLSIDPDSSVSHNLMGIILWKLGNFKDALDEFNTAIEKNRNNAAAHMNYGLLLFENGTYKEAEKHFEISRSIDDTVAETHFALGLLFREIDRDDKAAEELEKALSLFEKKGGRERKYDPEILQMISAYYVMSELYAEKGEIQKALELLKKGTKAALGIEGRSFRELMHKSEYLMIHE